MFCNSYSFGESLSALGVGVFGFLGTGDSWFVRREYWVGAFSGHGSLSEVTELFNFRGNLVCFFSASHR